MATKELQRLRLSYTAAYSAYMTQVLAVSGASQRGEQLSDEQARSEQMAFTDFEKARKALLHEITVHGKRPK